MSHPFQAFDTAPDDQPRARHHLRMQTAEAADDAEQAARTRARVEMLLSHTPGRGAAPAQFQDGSIIGLFESSGRRPRASDNG